MYCGNSLQDAKMLRKTRIQEKQTGISESQNIDERLNAINRKQSNGQKFNRKPTKKGKFYRQPSRVSVRLGLPLG